MDRCIYCCNNFSKDRPRSKEHIIPEFLGGFWWERFACVPCNSELGSAIDAEWQQNHEAVRALSKLNLPVDPNVFRRTRNPPTEAKELPSYELVEYAKTKAPFFVDRPNRVVNIDRDFSDDHVKGIAALAGIVQTDYGIPQNEASQIAKEAIAQLTRLKPGQIDRIEKVFPRGKLIISSSPNEVEGTVNMMDHFKPTIPVRSVVKIAYAFAAVLLQNDIFQPEYEIFRKFLMMPESGAKIRAMALDTIREKIEPFHVLAARTRHDKLHVVLILFHQMAFIVELGPAEDLADTQCLFDIKQKKAGLCHFAPETEDALNYIFERDLKGSD